MHTKSGEVPVELENGDLLTRGIDWGGMSVRVLDLPAGTDFTPLMKGLPGDRCQCPHWGVVTKGSITVQYEDGTEETTAAGEVFYWPGGHTGWTDTGVSFYEFSPADEIAPVLAHFAAQLTAS